MRFIFAILFFVLFYGGTNLYIGRRMFQWLGSLFPGLSLPVFAGVYIFFALSLILGFVPLPSVLKGIMRWIGSYWMGIYIYLLIFFLIAEAVLLVWGFISPVSLHVRFYAGLCVVLLTAGVVCYGVYNAHQLKTVSYEIKTDSPALEGLQIVLISDLHLGEIGNERRLDAIVKSINSSKPDIVCLVGDIFNDDFNAIREPDKASALLKSIESTYGVYASLGNHDAGRTLPQMTAFLEESGIMLLNDDYAVIDNRLVIAGRLDPSPIGGFGEMRRRDFAGLLAEWDLDAGLPVLVMDHSPAGIHEYGEGVDMLLTGHTHRGQVFPGGLFTRALFAADYGVYRRDGNSPHVIVTQGAGTWMMPMRVGTDNEVVIITLLASL
jgi:hypothetical protein